MRRSVITGFYITQELEIGPDLATFLNTNRHWKDDDLRKVLARCVGCDPSRIVRIEEKKEEREVP